MEFWLFKERKGSLSKPAVFTYSPLRADHLVLNLFSPTISKRNMLKKAPPPKTHTHTHTHTHKTQSPLEWNARGLLDPPWGLLGCLAPGFPGLWPHWPYFWGMYLSHILPFPLLEKYRSNKPDYEKWKPKPTKTEPLFVSRAWIQMAPRQAPESRGGNRPSPFSSHPCPQILLLTFHFSSLVLFQLAHQEWVVINYIFLLTLQIQGRSLIGSSPVRTVYIWQCAFKSLKVVLNLAKNIW